MSQIDREMARIERGPGFGRLVPGIATLGLPLHRTLPARTPHESWIAQAGKAVYAGLEHAVDTILTWRERAMTRRHLLTLDDRLLKDMGITRTQAFGEAEKPFWRV